MTHVSLRMAGIYMTLLALVLIVLILVYGTYKIINSPILKNASFFKMKTKLFELIIIK